MEEHSIDNYDAQLNRINVALDEMGDLVEKIIQFGLEL